MSNQEELADLQELLTLLTASVVALTIRVARLEDPQQTDRRPDPMDSLLARAQRATNIVRNQQS